MPQIKVNEIPVGINTCKVMNFNKNDVNSNITNYYQFGIGNTELSVTIDLLLLMMEEPLFDQLRTKQQLGYSVSCRPRDTFGVAGFSITVCTQANKYTTDHVDERIEQFLISFDTKLRETTDEEFESVVESLIETKSCADIHLKEEVDRNWNEILKSEYAFDKLEREIEILKTIKIENLRDLFKNHTIGASDARKLSVHVVGTGEECKNGSSSCIRIRITKRIRIRNYILLQFLEEAATEGGPNYGLDFLNCSITNIENYKLNLNEYPTNLCTCETSNE